MGKIKVEFSSSGIMMSQVPNSNEHIGIWQHIQKNYGTGKFEDLEIVGDDFTLEFKLETLSKSLDWDKVVFPSSEVKEMLMGVVDYHQLSEQIRKINNEVKQCSDSDGYRMQELGKSVVKKLEGIKLSRFFEVNESSIKFYIDNINHTLNKEVGRVIGLRSKDSKRKKMEALESAISHLQQDILSAQLYVAGIHRNSIKRN